MTWEEFYGKFYDWAESTQISRISQLTSFGSHDQVAEIIENYSDEKVASRLAKKALDAGVRFTPEEIVDLAIYVSKECMNRMVTTALGDFTEDQVEELVLNVDDDIYVDLEKRYCHSDEPDEEVENPFEAAPKQKKPGKLFGLFAFVGMAAELGNKKPAPHFHVGDRVRVRWRGQEGTIIDINGGLYMVSLNGGRTVESFPESDLEKAW